MNDEIVGFDALYRSMTKCIKGVRWKDSVAHYHLNAIEETLKLEKELHEETYKPRKPKEFTIYAPKRRDILSVSFRDRVYQRSLNDNAIYPQMAKSFIRDNYACQSGKGTDKCRDRLEAFLHRYYINHGTAGFVLYFDIHGYYPNMSHAVAEATFQRKLDAETSARTIDTLRAQYKGETGYNPGSQMIQIAGVSVLDRVDHFIKEQLRCKMYLRYMDDMVLISPDRAYLERCQEEVTALLHDMGFEVNEKKTGIRRLEDGILFLGFTFQLTKTGKVLRLISPTNVKNERKRLVRLFRLAETGEIELERVALHYQCWRNHASKGNTWKLLRRMDSYYYDLRRQAYANLGKSRRPVDPPPDGTVPGGAGGHECESGLHCHDGGCGNPY